MCALTGSACGGVWCGSGCAGCAPVCVCPPENVVYIACVKLKGIHLYC